MIFFCEDCGQKNILVPAQIETGKAVFRCDVCGYMNSYAITSDQPPSLKETDEVFQTLSSFPEIIGSFLFHKKKGVLKNHMPGMLKESDLVMLGRILTKNISVFSAHYPDVYEMVLVIANKNMTVKMISKNSAVIIASKTYPLSKSVMDQLTLLGSETVVKNGISK